jgi:flagellar protein FlbD
MIHLTRLNNQPIVVNADLVKFIENAPDTVITLLTGEKLIVRESVEEVLNRIRDFQRRFYRRIAAGTPLDNAVAASDLRGDAASLHSKPPDDVEL